MRIDKLTSKLQSALADAQSMAAGGDNNFIEPSHLLLTLMDQKGGSVRPLLSQTGFDITDLRAKLQTLVDDLPKLQNSTGEISVSSDLAKVLNQADKIAQQKGDSFVSSETILLVAMRDAGAVGKLLNSYGVSEQALENAIANLRGGANVDDAGAEDSWQALKK